MMMMRMRIFHWIFFDSWRIWRFSRRHLWWVSFLLSFFFLLLFLVVVVVVVGLLCHTSFSWPLAKTDGLKVNNLTPYLPPTIRNVDRRKSAKSARKDRFVANSRGLGRDWTDLLTSAIQWWTFHNNYFLNSFFLGLESTACVCLLARLKCDRKRGGAGGGGDKGQQVCNLISQSRSTGHVGQFELDFFSLSLSRSFFYYYCYYFHSFQGSLTVKSVKFLHVSLGTIVWWEGMAVQYWVCVSVCVRCRWPLTEPTAWLKRNKNSEKEKGNRTHLKSVDSKEISSIFLLWSF